MPEVGMSPAELEAVVREVVTSLDGDIGPGDVKLYAHVAELASMIEAARREIGRMQPDSILSQDIPTATDELDAIVAATETATGEILDSVERIEKASATLEGEAATAIQDAVTKVYEACNFQDITGQRITKVVRAFQAIEQKLTALMARFASVETGAGVAPSVPARPVPAGEEALLNGPALPGGGVSQAEIDKLLASFD
jgi:chemotaxis protein CheZ